MSDDQSHWILGLVYSNAADPRIFVPLPSKLGLALNFGNPRVIPALTWIWIIYLVGMTVVPIALHPLAFVKHPSPIIVLVSADMAALIIVRLNGCFTWSDYRLIYLTSYGLVAASAGFLVQTIINGPLVLWWGMGNLSWLHHLLLAPVAAIAQTFGRVVAIILLLNVRPTSVRLNYARYGLFVGLGFTVAEIAMFYVQVVWAEAPWSWLGLCERVSASMFHIYAAGLVALALWSKRARLIMLVVAIHALMDFLAGTGGWPNLSIYGLETIFSILALVTWWIFLFAARPASASGLSEIQVQPSFPPHAASS